MVEELIAKWEEIAQAERDLAKKHNLDICKPRFQAEMSLIDLIRIQTREPGHAAKLTYGANALFLVLDTQAGECTLYAEVK